MSNNTEKLSFPLVSYIYKDEIMVEYNESDETITPLTSGLEVSAVRETPRSKVFEIQTETKKLSYRVMKFGGFIPAIERQKQQRYLSKYNHRGRKRA